MYNLPNCTFELSNVQTSKLPLSLRLSHLLHMNLRICTSAQFYNVPIPGTTGPNSFKDCQRFLLLLQLLHVLLFHLGDSSSSHREFFPQRAHTRPPLLLISSTRANL
jgi:hypothetical protein